MQQRQFSSGSRQAPDPFDQFLEENNFYRKHTARDASCLFRVISEQMYDTQLHHLAIRKKCVRYMRKNHNFFAPLVERDLDEYLDDMSKPKTYGTLIELQAVGYMFQRNVLLFEPFNLGNFYISRSCFNGVFRVFYTPERHFDSVFTCDYIKDAAICQAICYEILYKDLYKLPDVSFAVEHMLHLPTLEATEYTSESNEDGYCTRIDLADGRSFSFDLPHETNCILENYELCHFHCTNFPRLSEDLQHEMRIRTNCDDYEKTVLCKTADSLLPHKYMSCVRQLLQEGITPFPYKVAKALDPNMYRNIEFDAWNEQRKEQKLQNWYNGDTNFKVGAKCRVKLCKSENDLYTCHIQEIAVDKGYCIVFIEQLGEKRLVPYDALTPLPPDQFKPWTLPYRFQRHMQKYSSVRFTRHYNYRFKLNGQFAAAQEYCAPITPSNKSSDYVAGITADNVGRDDKQQHFVDTANTAAHHRNGCYYKLKQYTHFENFHAHTVEYCTMPLTVEHVPCDLESKSGSGILTPSNENAPSHSSASETRIKAEPGVAIRNGTSDEMVGNFNAVEQAAGMGGPAFILPDFHYLYPMPQYGGIPEECYAYGYDPIMHPPSTAFMPTGYYMYPPPAAPAAYTPTPNNLYMQTASPFPPPHALLTAAAPHPAAAVAHNVGTFYQATPPFGGVTPANGIEGSSMPINSSQTYDTSATRNGSIGQTPSLNTSLSGRINWDAKKSIEANGIDLPTDVPTLRHFYNLGLDYHHKHLKRGNEVAALKVLDGKETSKLNAGSVDDDGMQERKPDSNNNMFNVNSNTISTSNLNGNNSTHGNSNSAISTQSQSSQYIGNNGGGGNLGTGKAGHMHRRFPPRYFNSNKDRPGFLRSQNSNVNSNNNNSCSNTTTSQSLNNRNQNDYNNTINTAGGNCKFLHPLKGGNNGQCNSIRSTTPNSSQSHSKSTAGVSGSAASVTASISEQGMPSPRVNHDSTASGSVGPLTGSANGNKIVTQTPPTAYESPQTNQFVASYNSYSDHKGDSAAPIVPPVSASGGIYLHMSMPTPGNSYGIYAPPAPPTAMGIHPAPTSTTCTPIPYPPPHGGGSTQHYLPTPSDTVTAVNMALHGPPNGFYPTPGDFSASEASGGMRSGDGLQFQCMPYAAAAPPPVPFYYSSGSAVAAAVAVGGLTMNGIATIPSSSQLSMGGPVNGGNGSGGVQTGPPGPQGYWCQPPNALLPLPTSTPHNNGVGVCISVSSGSSTPNINTSTSNNRSRENK